MFWLKKFPWLSLILLFTTYSIFGWYVSEFSVAWSHWLAEQGKGLGWGVQEELYSIFLYIFSAIIILLITFGLTAPVAIITFFVGSPLKSDIRAMFSVLAWSFAVVMVVVFLQYFLHLLLLVSAAILARLGLQDAGCNTWQSYLLLSLMSLGSFLVGIWLFTQLGRPLSL
ncbi:hypothetical protein [Gloeothece verrucosa]|uniref:Uncharacterized protein n=1 Tax=Gloeothece verrucosa (strain PCC 7822) TaxID=497965 RepID=E0UHY1_GLOV7|nr:hypothetical protein [Gloeothece verrucosa]ADN14511.1 conserved hypothetical protein [Gloeothece verrucosa PCC 7822]